MKNPLALAGFVLAIIVGIYALARHFGAPDPENSPQTSAWNSSQKSPEISPEFRPAICFDTPASPCFHLEIADDPAERSRGLMNREFLPAQSGMLFIFDRDDHRSFRMKNTLIPLDLLRLDADFRVVDVQTLQPCVSDPCPSSRPAAPARFVLEINADLAQQFSLRSGIRAEFLDETP